MASSVTKWQLQMLVRKEEELWNKDSVDGVDINTVDEFGGVLDQIEELVLDIIRANPRKVPKTVWWWFETFNAYTILDEASSYVRLREYEDYGDEQSDAKTALWQAILEWKEDK